MAQQNYKVALNRSSDGRTTVASVRDFTIELGSKSGDPSCGFNPAETLLASAGACITSSLGLVAANSGVRIDSLAVQVSGLRQDKPPRLLSIHYELTIDSPDIDDRITRIIRIAERNSTVLSTLKEAVQLTGEWHRADTSNASPA
jgi:uncharacterized OsmC-like protein